MKNMLKGIALGAGLSLVGASIYVMNNNSLRRQTAKKITKAMNNMESAISKKMN